MGADALHVSGSALSSLGQNLRDSEAPPAYHNCHGSFPITDAPDNEGGFGEHFRMNNFSEEDAIWVCPDCGGRNRSSQNTCSSKACSTVRLEHPSMTTVSLAN